MPAPLLASVVIIADTSLWTEAMSRELSAEGFRVVTGPRVALSLGGANAVADAAIIDLALTARPVLELITEWRERFDAPILAVAHSADEALIVGALEAGADQIAMIDAGSRLLAARLRSLLRRRHGGRAATPGAERASSVTLLPADVSARVNGAHVELTEQEFAVLELLLERPDRVVRRAEFLALGGVRSGRSRSLDFVVRRLRQKLEAVDACRRITAVRGVGFRFRTSCSCDALDLRAPDVDIVDITDEGSPSVDRTFTAGSGAGQHALLPSLTVTGEAL